MRSEGKAIVNDVSTLTGKGFSLGQRLKALVDVVVGTDFIDIPTGEVVVNELPGGTILRSEDSSSNESEDSDNKGARDSSKNEKHGDGGREMTKSEKQIKDLESQLQGANKKEKNKIKKKIQNIKENAQKRRKVKNIAERKKETDIIDFYTWKPNVRVGSFKFGATDIDTSLDNEYYFEPCDNATGWDTHFFPTWGVNVYTDSEKNIIQAIKCENSCIMNDTDIVGLMIQEFFSIIGQEFDTKDSIEMPMDSTVQDIYDYDDLNLQIWVKNGVIVTVIVSSN